MRAHIRGGAHGQLRGIPPHPLPSGQKGNLRVDSAAVTLVLERRKAGFKFSLTAELSKVVELGIQRGSCKLLLADHGAPSPQNGILRWSDP